MFIAKRVDPFHVPLQPMQFVLGAVYLTLRQVIRARCFVLALDITLAQTVDDCVDFAAITLVKGFLKYFWRCLRSYCHDFLLI